MRKRYLAAAGAAVMLAAGGAVAFADSAEPAEAGSAKRSDTVTLPTGDAVAISSTGNVTWHAAPDREGEPYIAPPAMDGSGDVITIPVDRMDEIAAGEEDPRRYNVSELLRAGQHDAAKAKKLSGKEYSTYVPVADTDRRASADAQKVTLTVTDRAGKPSGSGFVVYINPETDEYGELELDANGQVTVELNPGRFDFHTLIDSGDDIISGVTSVTVADAPVEAVADGSKAAKVEYDTDRPATAVDQTLTTFTRMKDGSSYGFISVFGEGFNGYVIPTGDQPGIGLEASPHLLGTDPDDPYTYDLNFLTEDGVPSDLTFTARDEDLAQVERTFDGLITNEPTSGCNNGIRKGGNDFASCALLPVEWQTTRTEYLTPGADLTWYANTLIGDLDNSDELIDLESHARYEAGPAELVTGDAPVAFNVGGHYEEPVLTRDGDSLSMYLPYMDNAETDEIIEDFHDVKGTAVLERDGEEIGRTDLTFPTAQFKLPEGDSGTYTLTAEVNRRAEVSPLAATTKVQWQFTSEPTEKPVPLDVSAVAFDAEGVTAGYADAGKPQDFTLDFQAQAGATDTKLAKLGFEVSYDDGKTWQKVEVDQDGDSATGKLEHPADAKFVSVRATATDDAGNKVTHSTVAAYGLK